MGSLTALRRTRAIPCLTAIAAGAILTWSATSTRAAWDGVHDVNLGDQIGAQFIAGTSSDLHQYAFYAPKDTTITGSIAAVKGRSAGLTTEWKLYTSMDVPVTTFDPLLTAGKLKTFKFAASGDYYFQVRATAGSGFYNLKTAPKFPKAVNGATTTGAFTFDALAGTVMGVTVKPTKGSAATPNITALNYLGGTVDLTGKSGKKATTLRTKLAKVSLPVSGPYTLLVDPGTAGQSIDVKVTLAPPKTGAVWSFGAIGPTRGLPAQNRTKWLGSGHADYTAMAFNDWNDSATQTVPSTCARCHTTTGYLDYLGADGSAVGVVNVNAPIGQVVNCDACHNDKADELTSVTFPSGLVVSNLGNEARCMVCHQGRESTVSVESTIDKAEGPVTIANAETAATGILGVGANIVAGATFTDVGAAFGANGITGGSAGVSYYYLEFVGQATALNGTAGVVTTKNVGRFKVTGVNGDTLTLDRSLAAETVAAGKSFQYRALLVTTDDSPMAPPPSTGQVYGTLGFKNVHYFAAGASLYGREAAGAFEYANPENLTKSGGTYDPILKTLVTRNGYDRKFTHVASKDTCIECHDPHSLEVRIEDCATCHVNKNGVPVANKDDLKDIRMAATIADYDGDGNVTEGEYYEMKGLQDVLYAAMQDYATKVAGMSIEYKGDSYPYYFEAGTTKSYSKWTANLLRAAYNYQFTIKDPGAFAHNGKYMIEILYDSISDLNTRLSALTTPSPVPNFANLSRNDPNHFDSDDEPYTDWDSAGAVSSSCSRCHSVDGFKWVVKYGVENVVTNPTISGMSCESCHVVGTSFAPAVPTTLNPNADHKPEREYVASVYFPYVVAGSSTPTPSSYAQIQAVTIKNGAKGTAAQDDSFVCMTCHRGRQSALTVEAGDVGGLTTNFTLSTPNSHYFPAGAWLYGSKSGGPYMYAGKTYVQRWDHDQKYLQPYAESSGVPTTPAAAKAQCAYCHMQEGSHSFEVEVGPATACSTCHPATTVDDLTPFGGEYNFDNDPTTKPKAETKKFADALYLAIQNYAKAAKTAGTTGAEWALYSDGTNVPGVSSKGFYKDTNHDGVLSATEAVSANASKWDSKGYRATFNYRFWANDPGAWAHNPKFVLQILYDSANDLDPATVVGLTRP
jgi:hypothetical protein